MINNDGRFNEMEKISFIEISSIILGDNYSAVQHITFVVD